VISRGSLLFYLFPVPSFLFLCVWAQFPWNGTTEVTEGHDAAACVQWFDGSKVTDGKQIRNWQVFRVICRRLVCTITVLLYAQSAECKHMMKLLCRDCERHSLSCRLCSACDWQCLVSWRDFKHLLLTVLRNPCLSDRLITVLPFTARRWTNVSPQFLLSTITPTHFVLTPALQLWALSRISPRVRVRVSVGIVYRIATGGYSWIWPNSAYSSVCRNTAPAA